MNILQLLFQQFHFFMLIHREFFGSYEGTCSSYLTDEAMELLSNRRLCQFIY